MDTDGVTSTAFLGMKELHTDWRIQSGKGVGETGVSPWRMH